MSTNFDSVDMGMYSAPATNITGLARFIALGLIADNGATVNLYGFSPAEGYMVGGVVEEWKTQLHYATGSYVVAEFIREHEDILSDPELFVGAWLNTETGMVHLDVSERFTHFQEAMNVAEFRDERAIYSLDDKQEIMVSV